MQVQFAGWPVWNYTFPTPDVKDVSFVKYYDTDGNLQVLDEGRWRMATGRNGVCALVLLEKHSLPKLASRTDAVTVEYEP